MSTPASPAEHARLLVLSGPSGAGKTSVARRLLDHPGIARAVTMTTRAPRGDERQGVDYEFVDEGEFECRLAAGELLEHAQVYGVLYGTPRRNVERILASGRHCLLVVDVQGVASLRALGIAATYVFVDVPSLEELARRLRARGEDSPAEIAGRLEAAYKERLHRSNFDLVVVNSDLAQAVAQVELALGLGPLPEEDVSAPPSPRRT